MTMPLADQPLVILNPAANRGMVKHYRDAAQAYLRQEPAEYIETTTRGQACTLAKLAAQQHRPVVVIGGDGIVNEAASGILMAGVSVPLGIVPAGSGNDFACRTLNLSTDPHEAMATAMHGECATVDAGMVNGRYFVNSFSVGLDGDITHAAERLRRYPLMSGWVLYYASTLRQLFFGYGRCPWMKISLDDISLSNDEMRHYVLAAITNGPTYGAGFRINPTANCADGLFDICTATYTPWLRALALLPKVQQGKHGGEREIAFNHAQHVHIESRQPVNGQLDGELITASIYDVHLLPQSLSVRVNPGFSPATS